MNRVPQLFVLATISFTGICTFTGCYTYDSISEHELINGYPKPEHAVRITLTDGSVIHSPEYLHIVTNEPTNVIVGIGQDRSKSTVFKGIIVANDLDSAKKVPTTEGVSLVCWLKNKTSLGFKEDQYLMLTSQDRPGFWCAGRRTTPVGTTDFKGMLTREQVGGIEVKKFDYETTAYIIAPVAIFFLAIEVFRGSLGPKIF